MSSAESFLINGNLNMSQEAIATLLSNSGVDSLVNGLVSLVSSGKMSYPLTGTFLGDGSEQLSNLLSKKRYAMIGFHDYSKETLPGNGAYTFGGEMFVIVVSKDSIYEVDALIDLFTEEERLKVNIVLSRDRDLKYPSPMSIWKEERALEMIMETAVGISIKPHNEYEKRTTRVISDLRSKYKSLVVPKVLGNLYGLKSFSVNQAIKASGVKSVSRMSPSMCKLVFDQFGSTVVLNPNEMWGESLLGAVGSSNVKQYIGLIPNSMVESFQRLIEYISEKKVEGSYKIVSTIPTMPGVVVDTVFTSLPLYNGEMYSEGDRQEVPHLHLRKWMEDVLFPMIDSWYEMLGVGGHLILNSADLSGNISSSLILYMSETKVDSSFRGLIPVYNEGGSGAVSHILVWYKSRVEPLLEAPFDIRDLEIREEVNVKLLQDASLIGGMGQRSISYFQQLKLQGYTEIISSIAAVDPAQVALAAIGRELGLKITIFLEATPDGSFTDETVQALRLGANLNSVQHGGVDRDKMMSDYISENKDKYHLLTSTLDEGSLGALVQDLKRMSLSVGRVWIADSDGMIALAVSMAAPEVELHILQLKGSIKQEVLSLIPKHKVYSTDVGYWEPARDTPYYGASKYHGAKLWDTLLREAQQGDIIINVK